jgi:hypothetical protein
MLIAFASINAKSPSLAEMRKSVAFIFFQYGFHCADNAFLLRQYA